MTQAGIFSELALAGLLWSSSLDNTRSPDFVFVLFTIISLSILFTLVVSYGSSQKTFVAKPILAALLMFWIPFFISLVTPPVTLHEFMRVVPFFVVSMGIIFIIPPAISKHRFLRQLSIFSLIISIIGIPTALIGAYQIGPLLIESHTSAGFSVGGIKLNTPSSIFTNSNLFALVSSVGLLSSASLYLSTRKRAHLVVSVISGISVVLAFGRASMLSAGVGLFLLIAYRISNLQSVKKILFTGCSVGIIGFLMLLNILPGPSFIQEIELHGRPALWSAGVDVIQTNPVFGIGLQSVADALNPNLSPLYSGKGVHNTYLYFFITGGIISGISYVTFVSSMVVRGVFTIQNTREMGIYAIFIAIIIIQMFSTSVFFGFSIRSVMTSLVFGYVILNVSEKAIANTDSPEDCHSPGDTAR